MNASPTAAPRALPEAEHRRYGRLLLWATLAGCLFLAGQSARLWQEHQRAEHLRQAVHGLYAKALEGEPGNSPYGRLQFELGKLKAQSAQNLDMVELLAALSRRAPEGVRITSLNMATSSGVVKGVAATPADFQRYQAALNAEASFTFTVNAADPLVLPVPFELKVRVRDRTAPPKGDDQ
jgi:hypothetical protein